MEGKAEKFKKPLVSPKGDDIENRGKQLDALIRVISFVGIIMNLYFVPLRLRETYLTEGFSCLFAHYALGAFSLIIIYATMLKMIGFRLFMVLTIPALIGFLATYEDLFLVCIGMVGGLVVFIIILSVSMLCDKNGDVNDIPLPATEERV